MMAAVANQVRVAVEEADLILLAVDSTHRPHRRRRRDRPPGAGDAGRSRAGAHAEAGDRRRRQGRQRRPGARPRTSSTAWASSDVIPVSAYHGSNTGDLLDAIVDRSGGAAGRGRGRGRRPASRWPSSGAPTSASRACSTASWARSGSSSATIPGTTRDAIDTELEYEGQRFLLIDTAGHPPPRADRAGDREVQRAALHARRRPRRRGPAGGRRDGALTAQDQHIAGAIEREGKGCMLVVNKWDLVEKDTSTVRALRGRDPRGAELHALGARSCSSRP